MPLLCRISFSRCILVDFGVDSWRVGRSSRGCERIEAAEEDMRSPFMRVGLGLRASDCSIDSLLVLSGRSSGIVFAIWKGGGSSGRSGWL